MKAVFGLFLAIMCVAGCSRSDDRPITASGTIEGTDVNVSAEVAGKVKAIHADEGARVKSGDTLALIDDADYRIQIRQATANEEAIEAQYALTLHGPRQEYIAQAEAALKNAETDYNRMKNLLVSQTITQKQYDDAYTRYVTAKENSEKLNRGSRQEEIAAARAKREQAKAQVEQLQKKIRDCVVMAPVEGIVTLKAVEPGEFVTVGSSLFRITYLDKVKLTIYVNETELGRVHLGEKATVGTDTKDGKSFEGEVIYISPTAEFTPKNVQTKDERTKLVFAVKIQVANPDGTLKPGLPADATLMTEESAKQ
ncbi:MAG: efflux RND transporter periplasmic adaptor subunit [Ignavibacteriae bacterium]|nr:efflux RND transporter periplasmic adaptor subunit [Ignavibacteriota bacterium]